MSRYLRCKFLNKSEDHVNFGSFTNFPLLLFRIVSFNFYQLKDGANYKERSFYFARDIYTKIFLVCYFYAFVSNVVLIITSETLNTAAPSILDALGFLLVTTKIWNTYLHKKAIWNIFQELEFIFNRQTDQSKKPIIKKYLDDYNRLVTIYAVTITILLSAVAFPIVPYLFYGTMQFVSKYWFPFDAFTTLNYPFVYAWINWNAWNGLIFFLGAEATLYALITLISMEFDILKTNLTNIKTFPKQEKMQELHNLINHHNNLLEICDKLQDIYSFTFLMSFVTSSMIMCLIAFILSLPGSNFNSYLFYVPYLASSLGQVLLLCMFGQKLMDSSESVTEGVFYCGWEEFDDITLKKHFILVIMRAQRIKRMTTMGFADISLETFTTVSFYIYCE